MQKNAQALTCLMLDNDVLSLLPTDSDDAIVRFFQIRVSPLDMYSIVIDNADFLDAVYQLGVVCIMRLQGSETFDEICTINQYRSRHFYLSKNKNARGFGMS